MQKIVEDKTSGHYMIFFDYRQAIVDQIKLIPGRRYDYLQKIWMVPFSSRGYVEQFARKHNFVMQGVEKERVMDYTIPPMPELKVYIPLKLTPYPYQQSGIAYNLEKKKTIIGDECGLGKTAQAIATITAAGAFPCLVICPSSLKINWQREWHMWTEKKALILNDQNKSTWAHFATGNSIFGGTDGLAQVFIVNYESLKKFFVAKIDSPQGAPLRLNHVKFRETINLFKSVIIDESHRVKEPKTLQAKLTKGITHGKEYILALTGTPVVNKPRDLVSQLGIIDQMDKFGGYKKFVERYCEGWNGASNLKELNYLLNVNCFYRRAKTEVLKELPAKIRQVVLCDINTRKEYKDALADLEVYLKKYRNATEEKIQAAMRGEVMVRIGILKNISARGKLNDVVEYISDIVEAGEKIVVFIHLKEVAGILKKFFPSSVTILGDDNMMERQKAIDSFQSDPSTQVIICSIKAAGVGITLTASSRVAFVELPWHPADSEQCEGRCHRIGAKDSVQCTYFLGKDTIDEWIYKVIDEKRAVANTITGATNDVEESVMDSVINLFRQKLCKQE